ncbi:MAG: ABC transporter ATP-binding protein [bacterium]
MSSTPALNTESAVEARHVSKRYLLWDSPLEILKYVALNSARRFLPSSSFRRKLDQHCNALRPDFYALRDISLEVKKGESLGVVGMNGAGKSTLLQLIAGTLEPTEGEITTRGRIAALLELGSGFHPEFTGRENIYLNAAILGLSKAEIEMRIAGIIAFSEIGEFVDKPVKTYSSGMVVRLAFSVVTQINPEILIVDEALSVGDAYFQHKSIRHMRQLRDNGTTLLFVSHMGEAIKTLCDRAILLHKGRLIQDGDPSEVVDYYHGMLAKREKDEEIRHLQTSGGRRVTRSGNRKAEITSMDVTNTEGVSRRVFDVGEKTIIQCVVKANTALHDPTVGFIIRDCYGNNIFGTNTYIHRLESLSLQAGDCFAVSFELTLNLGYGNYAISFNVHAGATHYEGNYDWLDHALVFQILDGGKHMFTGTAALPVRLSRRTLKADDPMLQNKTSLF